MRNIVVVVLLLAGMSVSACALARSSPECDYASTERKPIWVDADYSEPGYQIGSGWADRDGRSKEQQKEAAESSAKADLVQRIRVTISSVVAQGVNVSGDTVKKEASSRFVASSEEELRGMKVKQHWIDKESCRDYVLVVISDSAIFFNKFKTLMGEGRDGNKNQDVHSRKNFLEEAKSLLPLIDFKLLPGEIGNGYEKQLDEALLAVNKELANAKGRMAVFAMSSDGSIPSSVLDRIAGRMVAANPMSVRLKASCTSAEDCIGKAKAMDFTTLTLVDAGKQTVVTAMGSYKGTIKITRTLYESDSPRIEKSKTVVAASVIGWSEDDLDWNAAADKAIGEWK